jgi:hypothetical protein
VVPERDVSTDIEPRRIAGQPRFGKSDERGTVSRGVTGQAICRFDPAREIRRELRLDNGDPSQRPSSSHCDGDSVA